MTSLNFTVTQQSDEIKSLLDQIELDHTNTVFSSDQWFKYNSDDGRISFTNIDDNGIVQNALHIKTTRKLGFTIAELAGEPYIQYNDAMNNTGQSIDEFLEKTIKHLKTNEFDALYLHNVRKDSHIYDYCQRHGTVIRQKHAPWIDLTKFEGYNAFFDDCSSTIRKVYRKLHREYDTQFQVYLDDEILTELVQEIIDLKLKQLNQLGKSSRVFMKAENLIKLTQIFTTTTNDYQTFVSTVRCNGKLVSGALSMKKGDIYYGYIVAMDTELSKFAPGNAHVLYNVSWSYDHGLTKYDFLSPADDYKFKWTKNNSTPVYDFLLPLNVKGRIFGSIYLKAFRPLLKKLYLKWASFQT